MLIKNGIIINAHSRKKADIQITNGIINHINDNITPAPDEKVIDATNCYILPGAIDAHTHFDMPAGSCHTSDDFYTGTKAAIAGGTTTIIDFAEPDLNHPLQEGLDLWHQKADHRSFCDYSFHMTVSHHGKTTAEEINNMKYQGLTSFKSYTAYKGDIGVDDKQLYRIMEDVKKAEGILCVHCENGDLLECRQEDLLKISPAKISNHPQSRPNVVEKEAISRVLDIASLVGTAVYIVHISTKEGLQEVIEHKKAGHQVYAETCPHYLLLDESKYYLPGFESAKYVMSPPLRSIEDAKALWKGIQDGWIDTVSTDHCSFNYQGQKTLGKNNFTKIPNGIPSVEHRLGLMLEYGSTHGLSLEKVVEVTTEKPARIFGLYPKKGIIQEGSDGDILIIKPNQEHTITAKSSHQAVDYSPYEGFKLNQMIQTVILRGNVIYHEGSFHVDQPTGLFLKR